MTTQPVPPSQQADEKRDDQITEDEASLYDRQIRLWGLEAQNRMRSSTVLLLSLRSLAHETIKNLVLAGIGRLIIMDDSTVTEEDLGSGFLFREEEGAVGQERITAASPQITSLNPLVSLTALPTLSPFVREKEGGANVDDEEEMIGFLKREKVDVVVCCDLERGQIDRLALLRQEGLIHSGTARCGIDSEKIDSAARKAGTLFYAAGTYGFVGYALSDLGENYEYVHTPSASKDNPSPALIKKRLSYPPISTALSRQNWSLPHTSAKEGGSPFRGLGRFASRQIHHPPMVALLALWELQLRNGKLPTGQESECSDLKEVYTGLVKSLGVLPKVINEVEDDRLITHLANHSTHFFPPTLAILGGLLAQDVLRALSRKDKPIANFLAVDSMGGTGTVGKWGMGDEVDVEGVVDV